MLFAKAHRTSTNGRPEETILVDDLSVRVVRKRIKNINLHVKPPHGNVEVSAPFHVPKSAIIELVRAKRSWINARQAALENSPRSIAEEATPQQKAEWKAVVSACVPALLETWEPIMGVKAKTVVYRNMKSRWGSCQPKTGRICINTRLALYPPECLEYVVVHELCHLIVSGHGPAFWEAMDRFLPTWKDARDKLKE